MFLDRSGKGPQKVAWICHGQGFTKSIFFNGKANVIMIKLKVGIKKRVSNGKKGFV